MLPSQEEKNKSLGKLKTMNPELYTIMENRVQAVDEGHITKSEDFKRLNQELKKLG
jgi:hypothetical protein